MERAAVSGRAARVPGPPIFQSIRFRLSLTYALAMFVAGALLIGGAFLWQVNQLKEPKFAVTGRAQLVNPATGGRFELLVGEGDPQAEVMRILEYNSYLRAEDSLKEASLVGLGILFVVAFITGWLLAGWALRPVQRMVTVARDISANDLSRRIELPGPEDEMKQLADTFDAMLERLQGSFEGQRRFVQDASHELRNPLAVARANLELALTDPDGDPDKLRSSAEVAMRSTERMSGLVDDLLEQARSGVPEVKRSEIDLAAAVRELVDDYGPSASARNLSLTTVGPMAPLLVRVDASAIRRAVGNLVVNAVKFAPSGTAITVSLARVDRDAIIEVTDEGPGIAEADQRRVFERFWRADTSSASTSTSDPTTATPGTGLGLSIVQQIAERHGGVVSVQSVEGAGSTFTLRLPIVGERTQV